MRADITCCTALMVVTIHHEFQAKGVCHRRDSFIMVAERALRTERLQVGIRAGWSGIRAGWSESIERHLVPDASRWRKKLSWPRAAANELAALRQETQGAPLRGSQATGVGVDTRLLGKPSEFSGVPKTHGETGVLCSRGTLAQRCHVYRN